MNGAVRNRQTEASECGLASLAMAASMLGSQIDLPWLRQRYPASSRGNSLRELAEVAGAIGLSARAVTCEMAELKDLQRPAILHWSLNHFVVLDRVRAGSVRVFDPALGYCTLSMAEVSRKFTGVAMELTSTPSFQRRIERSPLKLSSLFRWTPDLKGGLAQVLVLSLVMQVYVVASPFYLQLAVDEAAMKGDLDLLGSLAVGFVLFAIFNGVADTLRGVVLQRLNALLSWDMSRRLFHHMVRLPLPWFQRRRLADAQSRFQALDPIKSLISNGLVGAMIDGGLSLVTAVMMVVFSPALALVTLVGLAIYVGLRCASIPISRRFMSDALIASIAEQGKRLETLRAIQTIKVMNGEVRRESDWGNKFADSVRANQASALTTMTFSALQRLFDSLTYVVIVYLGVQAILKGSMTVGLLYAFMAYRTQFLGRTTSLFEQLINWRLMDVYAFRLADVVLTPVEADVDKPAAGLPDVEGRIELDHVSFRYGPTDPFVLKDVSLAIAPGDCVAIVGPSGTGKSTLLKVLCGLYPPTSGEVRLDGLPLTVWGAKSVRKALGVVMQDDELLPGSIADNVAFFDEQVDLERVWDCLRLAAIDEEVNAMPMRADTFVGDMGGALSGGQKQRVLLARALYKQPRLLVLDEATSHLDIGREKLINAELKRLKITRIVVAHRPETIAIADRVILLQGGAQELARPSAAPMNAPA
ncbi:ATP-binding cassette subfamily B protein RaxB [Caulobacter ginsengisoli]|uniref:ATP-binding cassette subfamily B protein RaxB n=1 Tax=Caulobacter ginsengisoli TaxID=400775 RepID=A0ABU0IN75_9CAUL|nr:peptidase domain-containing ABC transporter [Caulobacter ginsengisoli]MDQ0462407.1 ATP-binding cassette subfamily B protein RaxB [Caulobacter ginsengisoli]